MNDVSCHTLQSIGSAPDASRCNDQSNVSSGELELQSDCHAERNGRIYLAEADPYPDFDAALNSFSLNRKLGIGCEKI